MAASIMAVGYTQSRSTQAYLTILTENYDNRLPLVTEMKSSENRKTKETFIE